MERYRVDFDALPWESPMAGVRFKVHKQGGRQLRLVEYTRDMEPHWCVKGHVGYILEGRLEITVDNKATVFQPGNGVFLPPGDAHKHMARVLTDMVRVVFVEDA